MNKKRSLTHAICILIILIVSLINFLFYKQLPMGWDDVKIFQWIEKWSFSEIYTHYNNSGNHILHTLLLKLVRVYTNISIEDLRYTSIIFSIVHLIGLYFFLNLSKGPFLSTLIIVIIALNPFYSIYSISLRGYILQCSLLPYLLLSTYYYIQLNDKKWLFLICLLLVISMMVIPTSIIFYPALLIYYLFLTPRINSKHTLYYLGTGLLSLILAILFYFIPVSGSNSQHAIGKELFFSAPNFYMHVLATTGSYFIQNFNQNYEINFNGLVNMLIAASGFILFFISLYKEVKMKNQSSLVFISLYGSLILFSLISIQPARVYLFFIPWIIISLINSCEFIILLTLNHFIKTTISSKKEIVVLGILFFLLIAMFKFKPYIAIAESTGIYLGSNDLITELSNIKQQPAYTLGLIVPIAEKIKELNLEKTIVPFRSDLFNKNKSNKDIYILVRKKQEWQSQGVRKKFTPELILEIEKKRFQPPLSIDSFSQPELVHSYESIDLYVIHLLASQINN